MLSKVPFVGSAIKNFAKARAAQAAGHTGQAIWHGTAGVSDIAFPAFIGKTLYNQHKEGKMTAAELARVRGAGFRKEAGLISGGVGLVGRGVKAVGSGIARHPLAATGVALGGAGMVAANRFGKAVKETRQQINPSTSYGGQFR